MTDSHKPSSQDDPYPDEDLLEGLEKLTPAFYRQMDSFDSSEDSKSMLLDSINALARNSQVMVEEVINETMEEEQDLTPLCNPQRLPKTMENEALAPIIGPELQEVSSINQVPNSPTAKTEPELPAAAFQEEKEAIQESQQQDPLLTFSHYNDRQ